MKRTYCTYPTAHLSKEYSGTRKTVIKKYKENGLKPLVTLPVERTGILILHMHYNLSIIMAQEKQSKSYKKNG
jgi:hypothetical protein